MNEAVSVLDFWFGPAPHAPRAEWFRKDAAFDTTIRARFGPLVETALAGGIDAWSEQADAALARVIVLDQFPRNLFRDSPRAFAGDARALAAARGIVARGWDTGYTPVQRSFVYLPFEHAESLAAQHEGLVLFEQLAADSPAGAAPLEWAHKHLVVIERFGRFPHRNAVLGRASTAEEIEFLTQPGSRF